MRVFSVDPHSNWTFLSDDVHDWISSSLLMRTISYFSVVNKSFLISLTVDDSTNVVALCLGFLLSSSESSLVSSSSPRI
ncbi:hypothetical protein Tco_1101075 [Tanacetum coccineum]